MANLSNINNKFLVTTGGNVGIGVTGPTAKLDIGGNTAGSLQAIFGRGNSDSNFTVRYTNGITGTNDTVQGTIGLDYANGYWADMAAVKFIRDSTAGELAFYTSATATSGVERMRIDSSGNVGIGTTSPAVRLDFGPATGKAFHLYTSGTDYYGFNMLQYNSGPFSTNIFSGNGGEIKLRTASGSSTAVTRLTVKAAGNVGIGTTNPAAKFSVLESTANTEYASMGSGSTIARHLKFSGFVANGTNNVGHRLSALNAIALNVAGDDALYINNSGNVGIGTTDIEETLTIAKSDGGDGTIVGLRSDASFSQFELVTKNSQVDWGLQTIGARNMYFATNGSERMRINSSGNIGIGTTVASDINEGKLYVNGTLALDQTSEIKYGKNNGGPYLNTRSKDGTTSACGIRIHSPVGSPGYLYGEGSGTSGTSIMILDGAGQSVFSATQGNNTQLRVNNQTHLYINNSGNVGIGTTSPDANLEISNSTTASGTGGATLRLTRNDATSVAGDPVGTIEFFSTDADTPKTTAYIKSMSEELYGRQGSLAFGVSQSINANATEAMRIDSSGRVGIGGINPSQQLELGGILSPALKLSSTTTNGGVIIFNVAGADKGFFGSGYHLGTGSSNDTAMRGEADLVFLSGGNNQRMRITSGGGISFGSSGTAYGTSGQVLTSNGNAAPTWEDASGGSSPWTTSGNNIYNNNSGSVGVNNTSPSSHYSNFNQLVVGNGTGNQGMTIFAGSNDESSINFTDTTSNYSNNFIIKVDHNDSSESNNSSFQINYENHRYVTINRQTTGSSQVPQVRLGMFNSSSLPANLDHSMLEIGINNGMNNPGMVMYGDSQGNSNPFIGMVSTSGSSQITTKFFRFYHNTTLCGTIQKRYNANEVQYLTTSDYRLKEDLKPFKALDTICKINVYNYKWKNIEGYNVNYGVLAHELQELIPEVVAGEKDEVNKKGEEEYQSVDYSKLVPHLIQSIQELKAEIDELKK